LRPQQFKVKIGTGNTMIKPLKTLTQSSRRALFLRKRGFLNLQKGGKTPKIPGAVAYRGNLFQKKFTGKEPDPETGLYYYGARYLDPKTSRWLSGDPALGEYLPVAGQSPDNLSGMGGVFNIMNLHAYGYSLNNPVKYTDPDGRNPVLDPDGNFIGTTENGSKGVPIVMNSDNFIQGMSEGDALNSEKGKGTYLNEYGKGINITDETWSKIESGENEENKGDKRLKPFVKNESNNTVYYKPEDDLGDYKTKGAYDIAPKTDLYAPVDGVKTSRMWRWTVYKVRDGQCVRIDEKGRPHIAGGFPPFPIPFFIGSVLAPNSQWHKLRDAFRP
jgi:RHS repeat-associated protein